MSLNPSAQGPKSVVFVGGSLGGLFAAVALRHLSPAPKVTVLERNPSPLLHNQGAGVVAGDDTQEFFTRFNRFDRSLAVTSTVRQYLNRDGKIIDCEEREQKMTSWDLLWNLLKQNYDGGGDAAYLKGYNGQILENEGVEHSHCSYDHDRQVTDIELVDDRDTVSKLVQVSWKSSSDERGSHEADLVIVADGPSSNIRRLLAPQTERRYAGYVAWRGTVSESELSTLAAQKLVETFTFYHAEALQILAYVIPGKHGTLTPGKRLVNWVWYVNYDDNSGEYEQLMTDSEGHRHRWTLPVGKIQSSIWQRQKDKATRLLPPQFAELVRMTQTPFVQAITDVLSETCEYWDGRVLLCGDAVAGFRPHTAASTSQASYNAMGMFALLKGELTFNEWQKQTMHYARETQRHGVRLGARSQFGKHLLAI